MKNLDGKATCPLCDKTELKAKTVPFFPSPRHANMRSNTWDKHFRDILEIKRTTFTPNTDIVISIATRYNFEKVAYLNRQSTPSSPKGFKDDGVRIPHDQIENMVSCLRNIEKKYQNFDEFEPMFRLEVGPNTDVVVSWKKINGQRRVFLNYRSQPNKNYDYDAHGVTFPFTMIEQIIVELQKMKSMIEPHY